MGEFANVCRAKQVIVVFEIEPIIIKVLKLINFQVKLEARVGFSSSVGKGLIEETKIISPKYLLIASKTNKSNR